MQTILVPLVAVMFAVGLFWFLRTPPAKLAHQLRTLAVIVLGIITVFLLMRGLASLALTFAALAIGLMLRSYQMRGRSTSTAERQDDGSKSRVRTEHLQMELDLASGDLQGRVLKGVFAGREISSMSPAELASLWQDCRFADTQSAQIIETYLDRIHPAWREDLARAEAGAEAAAAAGGRMTVDEACNILGLTPGASAQDVRRAHRELMKKLHPDRGGSSYLAAKINEAKEFLLQDRKDTG